MQLFAFAPVVAKHVECGSLAIASRMRKVRVLMTAELAFKIVPLWCPCCSCMQQYVPLFLTKEDLDVAVSGAYRQRNAAQISAVKDKVRVSTSTTVGHNRRMCLPPCHVDSCCRHAPCCLVLVLCSIAVCPAYRSGTSVLHGSVCHSVQVSCASHCTRCHHGLRQRSAEMCCLRLICVLQAAQFEAEYQAVRREAEEASGRDKSVLEAKAGKVKSKLDDALSKVTAIEVAPLPKVEVRRTG